MGLTNVVPEIRTMHQLLTSAETAARRSGDDLPGPEHLVLASLGLRDGTAIRALARFGIEASHLQGAIDQTHAQALAAMGIHLDHEVPTTPGSAGSDPAKPDAAGPDRVTPRPLRGSGVYRSTAQGQELFQEAIALSKRTRPSRLLGAHVLAAGCAFEHGTLARTLTRLGIDRESLRQAALDEAATAR